MSGGDMSSGGQGQREVIPVVPQAMSREGSISLHYPMLNKSNYSAWCIKMEVYMEAQGVWEAVVSQEPVETRKDKMALAVIYQSISEETLLRLGAKKTAKEAWENLKTMHLGAGRVKEVRAQALRWELEGLRMGDHETIDDFTGKIIVNVNHLRSLGEEVLESYVVKKILRAVSPKFLQIASTIEEFGNLETKTIEEVTGSLKAHEERMRGHDSRSEEQVLLADAKLKKLSISNREGRFEHTHQGYDKEKGPSRGGSSFRGQRRSIGDAERCNFSAERRVYDSGRRQPHERNQQRFDISKIRCYACNEFGHFASNCKTENLRREEAHLVEDDVEEPALLMMEESEMPLLVESTEEPKKQDVSQTKDAEKSKSLSKTNEILVDNVTNLQRISEESKELRERETSELSLLEIKLKEKAKFEAEWEDIDVRREELIKEAKYITRQKEAFSLYLKDERDNIREERDALRNQHKNDVEALNREREEFMNKMVEEHSEWHRKIQRERADLVLSFEMQKRELEYCIERKREELENSSREREKVFEQDIKLEKERIQPLKESAEKGLEHVQVELKRLDNLKGALDDMSMAKMQLCNLERSWEKVSVLKQKVVTRDDELDVQNGVSPVSNNEDGYNSSMERQNGSTSSGKLKLDSSKKRRKDVTKKKNSKFFVS